MGKKTSNLNWCRILSINSISKIPHSILSKLSATEGTAASRSHPPAKPDSKEHRAVISAADHSLVGIQSSQVRGKGGGWIHAFSPGVFFPMKLKDFMGFFGQKNATWGWLIYIWRCMHVVHVYMYISCIYIYIDVCIKSYLHTIYIYIHIKDYTFCIPFSAKSKSTKTTGPKTSEVYVSTG